MSQTRAGRLLEMSRSMDSERGEFAAPIERDEKKKKKWKLKALGLGALASTGFVGGIKAHANKDDIRKGIIKNVNKAFGAEEEKNND